MNEAACGLRPGPWREHDPPPKLPFTVSGLGTGRPSYADPPGEGLSSQGREHERFFTNRSQTQENLQLTVQTQPPRTCIP